MAFFIFISVFGFILFIKRWVYGQRTELKFTTIQSLQNKFWVLVIFAGFFLLFIDEHLYFLMQTCHLIFSILTKAFIELTISKNSKFSHISRLQWFILLILIFIFWWFNIKIFKLKLFSKLWNDMLRIVVLSVTLCYFLWWISNLVIDHLLIVIFNFWVVKGRLIWFDG